MVPWNLAPVVLEVLGLVLTLIALKLPGTMATPPIIALLFMAKAILRVLVVVPQVVGTQVCYLSFRWMVRIPLRLALIAGVALFITLAKVVVIALFRLTCLVESLILVSVRSAKWKEQPH